MTTSLLELLIAAKNNKTVNNKLKKTNTVMMDAVTVTTDSQQVTKSTSNTTKASIEMKSYVLDDLRRSGT